MPEDVVNVRCPNLLCRAILAVPVEMRGQRVRCGNCGEVLAVPNRGVMAGHSSPAPTGKDDNDRMVE